MDFDKKEALEDLIRLEYYQGLHSGRWEDEYNREEEVNDYWENMVSFADKYYIEYDDDLNHYGDEKDEDYYRQEEMSFTIKEKVEEYLTNLILGC